MNKLDELKLLSDGILSEIDIPKKNHKINLSQLRSISESEYSDIGIFWLIGEKDIIQYSLPVNEVPKDYDVRDVPVSHYSYWRSISNKLGYGDIDYTHFPRGRVIWSIKDRAFKVFGPTKLTSDQDYKDFIRKNFNLVGRVIWVKDHHYDDYEYQKPLFN